VTRTPHPDCPVDDTWQQLGPLSNANQWWGRRRAGGGHCSHPDASAYFDTMVVDWPVVADKHSRGVDLGASTAKSLTVGPHRPNSVRRNYEIPKAQRS
jgi:hypothetical protein